MKRFLQKYLAHQWFCLAAHKGKEDGVDPWLLGKHWQNPGKQWGVTHELAAITNQSDVQKVPGSLGDMDSDITLMKGLTLALQ